MKKTTKMPVTARPSQPGRWVRVMTADERSADMKAFGKEICKSKESAIAFLKDAGILDENGELAGTR